MQGGRDRCISHVPGGHVAMPARPQVQGAYRMRIALHDDAPFLKADVVEARVSELKALDCNHSPRRVPAHQKHAASIVHRHVDAHWARAPQATTALQPLASEFG
ncbi:hypothetical protein XFF7767_340098 [Xanthomonas citri pv. fuscans]|nr:hypothetical protein XFF6960_890097 [Xanthomonas citri pv. fuscans]SOO05028.1 hypothetical protein XFF7767_340098 [Xanthomonas citri pv. fuscans]SOO12668.1 hypothetical protein XFF7766_1130023 [Xanthomonas citri pv. fuscans]SOO46206.1 hypothetical protein XFF1815_980097 [Xanthomonas citri pv. fuscans]